MPFAIYMDADGIPCSDYGLYKGIQIGRQRSVLAVASRGLWYWNTFDLGGRGDQVFLGNEWTKWPVNRDCEPASAQDALRMFFNCAEWLLGNCLAPRGNGAALVWAHPYPFNYGTAVAWCSSHSQAVGIQLLLRAAELSGDPRYSLPIERLLAAFEVPVAEGGMLEMPDASAFWYEKVASPGNSRPMVLNGHMFALLGLHDIYVRTGNDYAQRLFTKGLASLPIMLPRFDLGDWSAYDLLGKRASRKYHRIHIHQLRALHELSGEKLLRDWRAKFQSYARKGSPRDRDR